MLKNPENSSLIEVKVPDHTKELENIKNYIDQLRNRFKLLEKTKSNINDWEKLRDFTLKTLELVGELSMPTFDLSDELHEKYILAYPHSPELAKKLWLDHCRDINKYYDHLKNKCFILIEDIDKKIRFLNQSIYKK